MADIINLADRRRKAPPSLEELIGQAVDSIMADWERFAKVNRLNDYFIESAAAWTEAGTNYLSDLNAISSIEGRIGLLPLLRAPISREQLGWQASFYIRSGKVHTPDMSFETYARCFNILLFLKLRRDLLAHGYTDEL